MKTILNFIIHFLSNLFNLNRLHVCRFTPSCSFYAREAMHKHGVIKGLWRGAWRVMRCQPWGKPGYDPA